MSYMHRIDTEELSSSIVIPEQADAGLQVIFGTAPVNMVDSPAINKPVVAYNLSEAVAAMGYCADFANYTICQAIDLNFNVFSNAPIIMVNVLDPAKHNKDYTKSEVLVASGVAKLKDFGVLKTNLVVKNGESTLSLGTDYTLEFDTEGYLDIVLTSSSITSVSVTGKQIDPSKVTKSDIIGGVNSTTGAESGLEVLRQIYPATGMVPGIVIAPGFSKDTEVAAAMVAKTKEINGLFECMNAIDIDTSTYKTYQTAAGARSALGVTSRDSVLLWPKAKLGTKVYDASAVWAAATASTDTANSNTPKKSPSNIASNMTAAVLQDGTEVVLDNTQAAVLNGAGIVTLLNQGGWKFWGNNTAAYPGTKTTEDRWIACRRMMNWYKAHWILTFGAKVDDPTDYRLIEGIVDSENIYLNSLAANGHIAGGSITFRSDENPITQILDGQIVFHTNIAFWTPAEHITNKIEFDPSLIQSALNGGN